MLLESPTLSIDSFNIDLNQAFRIANQQMPSSFQPAVKLRPCEIGGCFTKSIIDPLQLSIFLFQFLASFMVRCRHTTSNSSIRLRSSYLIQVHNVSVVQPIFGAIELITNHCDSCTFLLLEHQSYRSFSHFR